MILGHFAILSYPNSQMTSRPDLNAECGWTSGPSWFDRVDITFGIKILLRRDLIKGVPQKSSYLGYTQSQTLCCSA